jgi:hypothetical protein
MGFGSVTTKYSSLPVPMMRLRPSTLTGAPPAAELRDQFLEVVTVCIGGRQTRHDEARLPPLLRERHRHVMAISAPS